MANTVTRTAARATGGAQQAGREFGRRVAGGAARKAMSEAGSVVLGAVVDMAVSRVDRVADRLDGVAKSGGTGLREALTGRPAPRRSDRKDAKETGTAVRVRVGAAFSLVVARAVALLQFPAAPGPETARGAAAPRPPTPHGTARAASSRRRRGRARAGRRGRGQRTERAPGEPDGSPQSPHTAQRRAGPEAQAFGPRRTRGAAPPTNPTFRPGRRWQVVPPCACRRGDPRTAGRGAGRASGRGPGGVPDRAGERP
jgi:hypothetical protein